MSRSLGLLSVSLLRRTLCIWTMRGRSCSRSARMRGKRSGSSARPRAGSGSSHHPRSRMAGMCSSRRTRRWARSIGIRSKSTTSAINGANGSSGRLSVSIPERSSTSSRGSGPRLQVRSTSGMGDGWCIPMDARSPIRSSSAMRIRRM